MTIAQSPKLKQFRHVTAPELLVSYSTYTQRIPMAERESKPSVSGSPLAPVIVDATAAAFSAHGAVMPARLVADISMTITPLAGNPATLSHKAGTVVWLNLHCPDEP